LREWREKNWGKEQIISQLRSEIEQKKGEIKNIGGTPLHEQELQNKKAKLANLEAQLENEKKAAKSNSMDRIRNNFNYYYWNIYLLIN